MKILRNCHNPIFPRHQKEQWLGTINKKWTPHVRLLMHGRRGTATKRNRLALRKHACSNIMKILPPKNENFQRKMLIFFHISAQNIDCGYSLEPPRWGGSNEYHNLCFWAEIIKIIYTPVNPSFICRFPLSLGVWKGLRFVIVALPGLFSYFFYYIKVGFKGVKTI